MSRILADSEVDLWRVPLEATDIANPYYESILDEAQRANLLNFKQPSLRANYVQMQAKRRQILAQYLDEAPAALKFAKGQYGKPFLINDPELAFNVSHSANCLVVAVSRNCDIGVDVEAIKPRNNLQGLASRCFAAEEQTYWQALNQDQQLIGFYRLWTAKEAFVKAVGRGIALGLDRCVIDTRQPFQWLRLPVQYAPAFQWQIAAVDLADQQVCCSLVHNKQHVILNIRQWL
ncbi:4'-phosphopantetheinyl transferase superfamily protein [Methylicorpusculum oleiharenae]|uniref:4'-phosphopantetheinyl transferase family protein n=1 Tax=Methylicorpusculum oleiharenae TaxID=1338687 RepID=UPI00135AB3A8|nr:4'-phosphopantetheinyl transferase superfamily protein [Methylicorpusculum oleiharenae]MCD2450047.1 4'-phosphopantetheinyl transferase superfamily protein [Methylicorpusculum oleiharenae]